MFWETVFVQQKIWSSLMEKAYTCQLCRLTSSLTSGEHKHTVEGGSFLTVFGSAQYIDPKGA